MPHASDNVSVFRNFRHEISVACMSPDAWNLSLCNTVIQSTLAFCTQINIKQWSYIIDLWREQKRSLSLCIAAAMVAAAVSAFLKLVRERNHKLYGCLKNGVHCSGWFFFYPHVGIWKLTEILCYFHYSHCSAELNTNSSYNAHAIYWNSVFLTNPMIFVTFFFLPSQYLTSNYHSYYWQRSENYNNHFHNALWKCNLT